MRLISVSDAVGSPNLTRRQKVVNEIYYTEQSYISQLQIIVDVSVVVLSYCESL